MSVGIYVWLITVLNNLYCLGIISVKYFIWCFLDYYSGFGHVTLWFIKNITIKNGITKSN